MGLGDWADDVTRWAERAQARAGALLEPTLRLGVTGLSRAGKTVFITSLAANLLRRGRMAGLRAEAEGRIAATMLSPQPDLDAPRFAFEEHLEALYGRPPRWPESTRAVSQLRISFRYQPNSLLGRVTGEAGLHLDIVDYPGEWLLDLGLMEKSYDAWCDEAVSGAARRAARGDHAAAAFIAWLSDLDPAEKGFEEPVAKAGAEAFAAQLRSAKAAGAAALAPGRMLLPGDLEGAPALTFAPLRQGAPLALRREMERRYEAYKRLIVRPFFRDHFARLDRQIVLVDALGAVSRGPEAAAETASALRDILAAFRPGESSWLAKLLGPALGGRRVDRLLLAVSRADHIHHEAHGALQALVRDLLARSIDRAAYKGATVEAMAIAAIRATVEAEVQERSGLAAGLTGGVRRPAVRGRLAGADGAVTEATLYPGEPPRTLGEMLAAGDAWDRDSFEVPAFAPPLLERRPDEGPPHLRLDRALEFLIGDKLA
ncbi:MAG: YcjX family protein [Pseudomonadota bacterium]